MATYCFSFRHTDLLYYMVFFMSTIFHHFLLQFTPQPASLAVCAKRRKINFSILHEVSFFVDNFSYFSSLFSFIRFPHFFFTFLLISHAFFTFNPPVISRSLFYPPSFCQSAFFQNSLFFCFSFII